MQLDAEPPTDSSENLDVRRKSREQKTLELKGYAGESAPDPLLSVVCPFPAQPARPPNHRGRYRPHGSKHISVPQATNLIEAVEFAKSIDLPLVAHLTLHWSGTIVFDDPDGARFAKVREGLKKVLWRRGIPVAWVWCRECKAHTDIVHCHLLFHLPIAYRAGAKLDGIKAAIERLVDLHGDGILGEFAVQIRIWPDPDGLYLIKGGGPDVWKRFPRIRKDWRKPQGIIHGKRCGTSQNVGPAARLRQRERVKSISG
jgi:hypothetical protein